jgi:hypothetical protein
MTTMYDGRDLTDQALDDLILGAELGHTARAFLIKTSKSILGAARVIHKAYELYYVPRAKVGRPKKHKPGSVLGPVVERPPSEEQLEQERQWNAFLEAGGFQMDRHQKLLRNYWRIGKRLHILEKYSENLPNCLDGLAALCEDDVKPEDMTLVLSESTPTTTAAETRSFLAQTRKLPRSASARTKQKMFAQSIQEQKDAGKSVFLFSMPAIDVTQGNSSDVALAMLILKQLGLFKLPADLELECGKDMAQLIELIPKQPNWDFLVSDLKRLRTCDEVIKQAA